MKKQFRPYIFHESTVSMCPHCMKTSEAKICIEKNGVYIHKRCPEHGEMKHLLEEDAEFFKKQSLYAKPGTISKTQTPFLKGCPYDCGLCPMHEQHTCIGLIEVTTKCNLRCPVCYANAGTGTFLPLKTISAMMDFYQDSEFGLAELLQISGGEPTMHPDIIEIIALAREKKVKYVMLNTNGLRIAEDEAFVEKLSQFKGGFEVYLQFDGFKPETYQHFRNENLYAIKEKAIKNLQKYQIPVTLVATIENGINDAEIGQIVTFGINTEYVRGINFQPIAYFGRYPESDIANRITLTGIVKRIEQQTKGMLRKSDFIPLPCHPERVAFTYLYKSKNGFTPITRGIDTTKYVPFVQNTFTFMPEDFIKQVTSAGIKSIISCDCLDFLKILRPLIPQGFSKKTEKEKAEHINENTFRISISSFVDAYNFDMKSMKKECVHIITPDLRKIPFSAYNMLHRKQYACA